MFKHKVDKNKRLLDNIKAIWESDHAEEITEAYNKILDVMATLDVYSANMVMSLVYFQTVKKIYESTVGKTETGGEQ